MWKDNYLIMEPTAHNVGIVETSLGIKVRTVGGNKHAAYQRQVHQNAYIPLTEPRSYQAKAHEHATEAYKQSPGFAFWWDPGTGKSKAAIDFTGHLYCMGDIDYVILLAPKGVHRQWPDGEIPKHSGIPFSTHWWNPDKTHPWISNHSGYIPAENDREAIEWFCFNYDAIKTKRGQAALGAILKRGGGDLRFALVCDESHLVKNYRSGRWKATKKLASDKRCVSRMMLSGTPISKSLVDEWSQLRIADESIVGIRYVTHFRNNYCIMGGFNDKEFIGPKNLARYRKKTAPYISRITKDEMLDLPPKIFKHWHFDMEPAQKKLFHQMRRDLIAQIYSGEIATAANAAVAVIRLQQISNGFLKVEDSDSAQKLFPTKRHLKSLPQLKQVKDGLIRDLFYKSSNPRVRALKEVLDDIGSKPVIIWCRFRWDVEMVQRTFPKDSVLLYGGLTTLEREVNVRTWLDGDKRLLISTPNTGGTGLNLQVGGCQHAIYYSNSEHYILRAQSEDRIHRIGSTGEHIIYYDLNAKGSRDMAILANLRAKKSLSDLVLDDYLSELESISE